MRSARILKALGALLRALLALVTLLGGVTLVVWLYRPKLVSAVEQKIEASYLDQHQKQLETAEHQLDEGAIDDALKTLENLLRRMSEVRKQDRLDPLKRSALKMLIEGHLRRENPNGALSAYDALVRFDDRDLVAQVERATLLQELPERRQEGEAQIEQLYRMAPSAPLVAEKYQELAIRRQDLVAATHAALNMYTTSLQRSTTEPWRFFWDTGNRFSRDQSTHIIPGWDSGGRIQLSATVEDSADLRNFRIDPPAGIRATLDDLEIRFANAKTETVLHGVDMEFRGLAEIRPGVLLIRPRRPTAPNFFFFELPEPLPMQDGLRVDFRASLKPWIPPGLDALLRRGHLVRSARERLAHSPRLSGFLETIAPPPAVPRKTP